MKTKRKRLRIVNRFKFIRSIIILIILLAIIIKIIGMFVSYATNIISEDELDLQHEQNNYYASLQVEYSNINVKPKTNKPDNLPEEYYTYLVNAAKDNDIPIKVILAIMTTENETYDPNIIYENTNGTYDIGLAQVNSDYYVEFGLKYNIKDFNPYDPKQSIEFIAKHMKYLASYGATNYGLNEEESYIFAAGAYNRGLSNECKYRNMYNYKERFLNNYNSFI